MQRRRLILAFTEMIASAAWDAISVERVCRHAGISRRTFYEVFDDREACFAAAVEEVLGRLTREVAPVFVGAGSWSDRVRRALACSLAHLDAEPGVARMLIVETMRAGPLMLALRTRVLDELSRAIDQGRDVAKGLGLPPLTGQGVVGGVLHLLQSRLAEGSDSRLLPLLPDAMAMIVHAYLGPVAAAAELQRAPEPVASGRGSTIGEPFKDLPIRFTYRTALVLSSIAEQPGASNREVADSSAISDQGQVSRLLSRLSRAGLIVNALPEDCERVRGERNAWTLTDLGTAVHEAFLK